MDAAHALLQSLDRACKTYLFELEKKLCFSSSFLFLCLYLSSTCRQPIKLFVIVTVDLGASR